MTTGITDPTAQVLEDGTVIEKASQIAVVNATAPLEEGEEARQKPQVPLTDRKHSWEIKTVFGRVHFHDGVPIGEALAMYAAHINKTDDELLARIKKGELVVTDVQADKTYSTEALTVLIGDTWPPKPQTEVPADAGHDSSGTASAISGPTGQPAGTPPVGEPNPQLADASGGGSGASVPVEPITGRDTVAPPEAQAAKGTQSGTPATD